MLATNVAETSLTVPGIRYVIDPGLARINRYSHRNKVEQLRRSKPIVAGRANQRAGPLRPRRERRLHPPVRRGRFRASAPAYTDPEILRSSLAGVILRMKALRPGRGRGVPVPRPAAPRRSPTATSCWSNSARSTTERELTQIGRELAQLPLDPRIGRMILAARDEHCLREMLVIAAALSVQDPRERPPEQAAAADQAHAKCARTSAVGIPRLAQVVEGLRRRSGRTQTQRKQRDWCRSNFLSYLRMREWREVHAQLHTQCGEHSWQRERETGHLRRDPQGPADRTARQHRPEGRGGSALPRRARHHASGRIRVRRWRRRPGRWIVAAELVETTRLYARCLARSNRNGWRRSARTW